MRTITGKNDFYPLLKLVLPLVLTGIVSSSIGFFETVFLAHLSRETMAAGALVGWFFGVFIVILYGILSSINVLISHKYGANDTSGISRVLRDGLLLSTLLSIPAIFLFWNMAPIFLFFGQEPSIARLAEPYLHALCWGLLPTFIVVALTELLLGLGHARIVMISTTLATLLALFFSFSLIFGKFGMPSLGIAGAGWGTSISYSIMVLVLCAYLLLNKQYQKYFEHLLHKDKPSYIWELLKTGLPMGLMYCFEVGFFFALTLIMGSFSSQLLAANQITLQYMGVFMAVIFSISQGVTVRMGHLIGSTNARAAKRAAYAGVCLSAAFMSLCAFIYWFFPLALISIDFNVTAPENSQIIVYTAQLFMVSAIFQLFEGARITFFGALRALKDTKFTLISSIISFWGLALPIGYFLAVQCGLGGAGLWWGMTLGAGFSMSLLWWRFKQKISVPIANS